MALAIFQILLTAAACFGLWRFWLSFAGRGKVTLILGAGFLIRALVGQALFWISWLHLPIGRSLQLGGGFWFFASDGPGYLAYADELIRYGPINILFISNGYLSRIYVQMFTTFAAAFGIVASVAILLNCLAYLLTCAIIVWFGSRSSRAELPLLAALAAVSFGPGVILWSLQPLKDTFFLLLITALFGACFLWQEVWRGDAPPKWRRVLACAAAVLFLIYQIAGIRWYFSAIVWVLSLIFFVLVALQSGRPWRALPAGAVLFVLISQAFLLGGDGDIPQIFWRYLDPRESIAARWRPSFVATYIVESRRGFERTPGATMIAAGPALAPLARKGIVSPPAGPAVVEPSSGAPGRATVSAAPVLPPSPSTLRRKKKLAVVTEAVALILVTGFTAMFVPKTLAQTLGLVRIGGGRGFWLFADIDTLAFDLVVLFALVYCVRALRWRARVTPLFVLLLLVFLLTAGPLMYAVANFGTLFRLRVMVYLIAAILPLTLEPRRYPSS